MNAPLILHCCANIKKNIICVFRESINISICIRSFLGNQIILVFVFCHFWEKNYKVLIAAQFFYNYGSVQCAWGGTRYLMGSKCDSNLVGHNKNTFEEW